MFFMDGGRWFPGMIHHLTTPVISLLSVNLQDVGGSPDAPPETRPLIVYDTLQWNQRVEVASPFPDCRMT